MIVVFNLAFKMNDETMTCSLDLETKKVEMLSEEFLRWAKANDVEYELIFHEEDNDIEIVMSEDAEALFQLTYS